jgi:D-alanyl-D-alanine dipeptidase
MIFFLLMNLVHAELVDLSTIDSSIKIEMRYATDYNFVGSIIDGYTGNTCLIEKDTAVALKKIQKKANALNLSLKVYDCYRPQIAVDHFVRWAKNSDESTKLEFYPNEKKSELFDKGYIAYQSGHTKGKTVDLTLVPKNSNFVLTKPEQPMSCLDVKRNFDDSLDMGINFDCFDEKAGETSEWPKQIQANRDLLKKLMLDHGFTKYDKEWWHFTFQKKLEQ